MSALMPCNGTQRKLSRATASLVPEKEYAVRRLQSPSAAVLVRISDHTSLRKISHHLRAGSSVESRTYGWELCAYGHGSSGNAAKQLTWCVDVQGMLRPAPLEVYESPVSVLNNPGAYSPQSILLPQHVVLRGHSRATQDPRIGQPPKRWRCLNHVGSIHTPVRNKSTPTHCSHRLNQRNISSNSHFNTSSGA